MNYARSKYDPEDVERADDLYDRMPLSAVSEVTGIPVNTLGGWAAKGLISSEVDWQRRGWKKPEKRKRLARRAARLRYDEDLSGEEIAERMNVSRRYVYRLLKMYRTGDYTLPNLYQSHG